MSEVEQIREAASRLSTENRAELAVFLLDSLDETLYWVDDEEILRRRNALDSGQVLGLTREEFRKASGR